MDFLRFLNQSGRGCLSSEMHQRMTDSFFLLIAKGGHIGQGNFLSMSVSPFILSLKAE